MMRSLLSPMFVGCLSLSAIQPTLASGANRNAQQIPAEVRMFEEQFAQPLMSQFMNVLVGLGQQFGDDEIKAKADQIGELKPNDFQFKVTEDNGKWKFNLKMTEDDFIKKKKPESKPEPKQREQNQPSFADKFGDDVNEPDHWTTRQRRYYSPGPIRHRIEEKQWKHGAYKIEVFEQFGVSPVYIQKGDSSGKQNEYGELQIAEMLPKWAHPSNAVFAAVGEWKYSQ